jgi:polar amino acid transport system substrate-binding protein
MKLERLMLITAFAVSAAIAVAAVAETINITTEEYPPFNMTVDGKIVGIATEIVHELFRRAGVKYEISLYPWKRAFEMAKTRPDHAVYSTTRTPDRENHFKWVGPLVQQEWVFFAKAERGLEISSLADVKGHRIGGYQGDSLAEFLQKFDSSFTLDLTTDDELNAKKLSTGRIDLWAVGSQKGAYIAKPLGITGLENVFTFKAGSEMYLAFNFQTSDALIDQLQATLSEMREDGTVDALYANYR